MALTFLIANLAHGVVALVWAAGLRRWPGRLPAALWANLLSVALVFPPMVLVARLAGVSGPADEWMLVRADLWSELMLRYRWAAVAVLVPILLGTLVIFVLQELLPTIRSWRIRTRAPGARDERLDASLERVQRAYQQLHVRVPRGRAPRALLLDTTRSVAALHGLVEPSVLVSKGLVDTLDDQELDAVLAHELAHHMRGGNVRLLIVWFFRAFQAVNPASLVIFRSLVEARELACDALASRAIGSSAKLAAVILKVHGRGARPDPSATTLQKARIEILRRAGVASTRIRVRALLDEVDAGDSSRPVSLLAAFVLGTMLWLIG